MYPSYGCMPVCLHACTSAANLAVRCGKKSHDASACRAPGMLYHALQRSMEIAHRRSASRSPFPLLLTP